MERAESFVIEIDSSNVETLLRQFNGDLHLLSSYLKIMNNRMVLLNPNFSQKAEGEAEPENENENEMPAQQETMPVDEPEPEAVEV